MLVLVANLGSTSFKYKLLDMGHDGAVLAKGGYERIGQTGSPLATHADAIDEILRTLERRPDAIGFKAVHGGPISGAVRVTDEVIATMEQFSDVAPAHNPPYIAAMRAFREKLPGVPQVAAFETGFHQSIPMARQVYGIPHEWTEMGIRRYGFHGASHRYIGQRMWELAGDGARIISCHLGGSCSVSAIRMSADGPVCVANSFGMTAQSGVFHNNRVGDFDAFAIQKLLKAGMGFDEVLRRLSKEGGLLGISGVSNDMRDVEKAAAQGNERAKLAVEAFIESVRHYIGAFLVVLGGCDALVFTGGIGENGTEIRRAICADMSWAGIELDARKNEARGREEKISSGAGEVAVWVVPTNEEMVVAEQTVDVLSRPH
jgi:acetate kinase